MAAKFADQLFKCIFLNEKCLNLDDNFTEVYSPGAN